MNKEILELILKQLLINETLIAGLYSQLGVKNEKIVQLINTVNEQVDKQAGDILTKWSEENEL